MARRTKRKVEKSLMVVDTKREIIDILQITNRRFMYNPQTGILILGDEAYGKSIAGSHAQEFYDSQAGRLLRRLSARVDRHLEKLSPRGHPFCPCRHHGAVRPGIRRLADVRPARRHRRRHRDPGLLPLVGRADRSDIVCLPRRQGLKRRGPPQGEGLACGGPVSRLYAAAPRRSLCYTLSLLSLIRGRAAPPFLCFLFPLSPLHPPSSPPGVLPDAKVGCRA